MQQMIFNVEIWLVWDLFNVCGNFTFIYGQLYRSVVWGLAGNIMQFYNLRFLWLILLSSATDNSSTTKQLILSRTTGMH